MSYMGSNWENKDMLKISSEGMRYERHVSIYSMRLGILKIVFQFNVVVLINAHVGSDVIHFVYGFPMDE